MQRQRRRASAIVLVLACAVPAVSDVARADDPVVSYERSRKIVAKESLVLELFDHFNGGEQPAYCMFELSDRKTSKLVSGSLKDLSITQCDQLSTTLLKNLWADVPAPAPEYDKFKLQRVSHAKAFKYVPVKFSARASLAKPPQEIPFEARAEVDGIALREVLAVPIGKDVPVAEFYKHSSFDGEAAVVYALDVPIAIDFYFREFGVIQNFHFSLKGKTRRSVSEVNGAGLRELLVPLSEKDRKALDVLTVRSPGK